MPLKLKIGGPVRYVKDREHICLTTDQAKYIYKKVEQEGIVNVETIKWEIEYDRINKDNIENEEEVNPY